MASVPVPEGQARRAAIKRSLAQHCHLVQAFKGQLGFSIKNRNFYLPTAIVVEDDTPFLLFS
jgi:hypothetical protein